MLKIKDNVDLKELEKYGFTPRYDTYTGEIYEFENIRNDNVGLKKQYKCCKSIISIFFTRENGKKNWYFTTQIYGFEDEVQDIIYDLIKADLVEKVDK